MRGQTGKATVLNVQPVAEAGQVILVRQPNAPLVRDRLNAKSGRHKHELRNIRADSFAGESRAEAAAEEQVRGDMEIVARAIVIREIREFLGSSDGERVARILVEGNIAQQGSPVQLNHFRRGLRAGNCGSGRNSKVVPVGTFEIESQTGLRVGQEVAAAHGDVRKVCGIAGAQGIDQTLIGA